MNDTAEQRLITPDISEEDLMQQVLRPLCLDDFTGPADFDA